MRLGIVLVLLQIVFSLTRCSSDRMPTINEAGTTIATRYPVPSGTKVMLQGKKNFAHYLSQLKLKPAGSKVHYYHGGVKGATSVYDGVVDMEIGKLDLQQCADAVIRLRAEYLFATKLYDQIHFNFTSGLRADYAKWKAGYRIQVTGNDAQWVKIAQPSGAYSVFRQYLDVVFSYAGTLSLSRELKKSPATQYANR